MHPKILTMIVVSVTLATSTTTTTAAWADEDECAASYENGQRATNANKLRAAKSELAKCEKVCPAQLAKDCRTWLADVDQKLGAIEIEVRGGGPSRCDLSRARVFIDNEIVSTAGLPTAPVPFEPGAHTVKVDLGDGKTSEKLVSVTPGSSRSTVATITFASDVCGALSPQQAPSSDTQAAPSGSGSTNGRGWPVMTWVLGGVGVVGLGGFAVMMGSGLSQKSDLDTSCKPYCDAGPVDDMQRTFLIGDIMLGVGVAALAGAVIVALTSSRMPSPKVSRAVSSRH